MTRGSFVTFRIDPRAQFSDGKPVLAEDVLFSWQLLRDKGRPNHRQYYAKVAKAEAPDERTVRFDFGGARRSRIAADPRPDAGAAETRRRIPTPSRKPRWRRRWAPGPIR